MEKFIKQQLARKWAYYKDKKADYDNAIAGGDLTYKCHGKEKPRKEPTPPNDEKEREKIRLKYLKKMAEKDKLVGKKGKGRPKGKQDDETVSDSD